MVGVWVLTGLEDHRPPSPLFAFAPGSQGLIIYTSSGLMSVQIARKPQS
ncbi:MAG: lipocalin-like domain-containing protein, partial [Candidatus Eremiobacteraeota bacterium]|nr:lipocalin-like domain-containing protein [Candidatus Eremiobacteraeota bacterium]